MKNRARFAPTFIDPHFTFGQVQDPCGSQAAQKVMYWRARSAIQTMRTLAMRPGATRRISGPKTRKIKTLPNFQPSVLARYQTFNRSIPLRRDAKYSVQIHHSELPCICLADSLVPERCNMVEAVAICSIPRPGKIIHFPSLCSWSSLKCCIQSMAVLRSQRSENLSNDSSYRQHRDG